MKVALCDFGFPEFSLSLAQSLRKHISVTHLMIEEFAHRAPEAKTFPYALNASIPQKIRASAQLVKMVAAENPNVIHLQGWSPTLLPFLGKLKKPLVFTWHDPVAHSGEKSLAMDLTQKWLVKRASRVIVLSEAMREEAQKINPNLHIAVIPHGVFDCYRGEIESKPKELNGKPYVLFFGRVQKYKGVEDLCAAYDGNLVIAGRHFYRLEIPDSATVINRHIPVEEVRYLFRHAELCVLPYRDATQSGVLMLGYAFGTPMVATETGGLPEMIKDTAMLVRPGDKGRLGHAIRYLLRHPEERLAMGKRGREYAEANYGWDRIAGQHLDVYYGIV